MTTIEKKHYIATPHDIELLATMVFEADSTLATGRTTYLRALVATVQSDLGVEARLRNGKQVKVSEEERTVHMKAFEVVSAKFMDAVNKAARLARAGATAQDLQSMTGFARSASSTLRGFIRASYDVRLLAAHTATKAALAVPRTRRTLTSTAIRRRVLRMQEDVVQAATNMHALNSAQARELFEPLLAAVAHAIGLDARPAKSADVAESEDRAWATKTGVFVKLPNNVTQLRKVA